MMIAVVLVLTVAPLEAQDCYPWSNGGCMDPCPHGRIHRCRFCKSFAHRGMHCPVKGKGRGRGRGKGGKS